MPQTISNRSHGYEMPPPVIHALVSGTTWALHCGSCRREIAVDVIKLVEGVTDVRDFNGTATFARAKCRECDGRLKLTGGFQLSSLKHTGHMPRLIVGDGTDFRQRPSRPILA